MNNLIFGTLLIVGFAGAFTGSSAIFARDSGPAAGFVRMVKGGNVTTAARSRAACHPSYRGQCLPAIGPDLDCSTSADASKWSASMSIGWTATMTASAANGTSG